MDKPVIFIVGVSRSGTSLVRRILNRSEQIAITEESHFMGHLIPSEGTRYRFRKLGDLALDENVHKLVDYIYSGQLERDCSKRGDMSYHWRWIIQWVDKEDLTHRILDSDRSERDLFRIAMQVYADHMSKPIMGDKTPIHIRYVPTLVRWFPGARIIHMLRDPRAIFASELRRRTQLPVTTPYRQLKGIKPLFVLFILLQTTLAWFESSYRYRRYKHLYVDHYYPLRFEDLVSDPENHVRQVCAFVGVEFQESMLEQEVVSQGFSVGQAGFDSQAATRWQSHVPAWVDAWFSLCFRKPMKELRYIG